MCIEKDIRGTKMEFMSGEEFLLGLVKLSKEAEEAMWAIKEHDLPKGHWRRVIVPNGEAFCVIITDNYVIGIKTGRVIFLDKKTKKNLDPIMGFHHLITGDVKPDESELVILESGKHFHIISLKTFEVIKKVSLPRTFYSNDVYCTYSEDGSTLTVPVMKYDYDKSKYVYMHCEYETENYTLISKKEVAFQEVDWWSNSK